MRDDSAVTTKSAISELTQPAGRSLFIAGAGVSRPSGLPLWPQLGRTIIDALVEGHPSADELRDAAIGIRPEVLLQALYRALGSRAIDVLTSIDPHRLRDSGTPCEPNGLHYFLAEMIHRGHIVVTTNFEDLVEEAYSRLTTHNCAVASSRDDLREVLPAVRDGNFSGLIKLHGSFRLSDGSEATETVSALLQTVQRAIPSPTREILEVLLGSLPTLVIGYSGLDDFDLYQVFVSPINTSWKSFVWLQHVDAPEAPWTEVTAQSVRGRLAKLAKRPIKPGYFDAFNPLRIVESRHGTLVKAHTSAVLAEFLPEVDWSSPNTDVEVERAVYALVQAWSTKLGEFDRRAACASVAESSGQAFLELARADTEWLIATSARKHKVDKAKHGLTIARLLYKAEEAGKYEEAMRRLEAYLTVFHDTEFPAEAAEAHILFTLLLNRLAVTEPRILDAVGHARAAIRLLAPLANSSDGYYFELGTALRAFALALYRASPDPSLVEDLVHRSRCNAALEAASSYARASLRAIDIAGNYLGERGQAQCWNVMGLIDLKIGSASSLEQAASEFDRVIELSRRAGRGFRKEEAQGHRNLGMVFRTLAQLARGREQKKLFAKSLDSLKTSEKLLAEEDKPPRALLFNVRFFRLLTEVDAAADGAAPEDAQHELRIVESGSLGGWHWSAWIDTTAARLALLRRDAQEATLRATRALEIYEQTPSDEIENQTYGVQNGQQNLADCEKVLLTLSAGPDLLERSRRGRLRLSTLSQRLPEIRIGDEIRGEDEIVSKLLSDLDGQHSVAERSR